jgi:carbamoyltransferase
MPLWLREKLHTPRELDRSLKGRYAGRFVFTEHHESHAASAFFPSPFEEAAILTLDGVGEWATGSIGVGARQPDPAPDPRAALPALARPALLRLHLLHCGFKVNSGEYKLMGLAPYGEPIYKDRILEKLLDLKEDGSFRLDMSYFGYCNG